MKILVLGNGFDLDHNLPTSYMDFLKFCNYVTTLEVTPHTLEIKENTDLFKKLSDEQQRYATNLKKNISDANKYCTNVTSHPFFNLLKNNHLLKYFNFKIVVEREGEHWIDFEQEIKSIVNEFKFVELELKKSNSSSIKIDNSHNLNQILKCFGLEIQNTELWDKNKLSNINKKLCSSLDDFSKALEYYISTFVNTADIMSVSPDIDDFKADKVITFNYSNTYERKYGHISENTPIDHIHGIAQESLNLEANDEEANIVLGITTDDKNLENYYVEFEKYFQRITRKTGNKYKKWLQQAEDNKEKIEVMFFGHSLDASDSDIIKDLIFDKNSVVKIYYFNKQTYKQIVANLIEIIGKDDLINFVWGVNPKIEFIQQREHQYINDVSTS